MDTQLIADEISNITIHNMKESYDMVGILAKANEPGQELQFALALVQYFYNQTSIGPNEHRQYRERALYTAKWQATKVLVSGDIQQLVERTTVYMLDDAKVTGWHVYMEYETLQELLASMVEGANEHGSIHNDIMFVADTLVPIAKRLKIPVEKLVSASHQMMKLRRSVPPCRRIIDDLEGGRIDADTAAEQLDTILSQVADTKITGIAFGEFVDKWTGKHTNKPDPFPGSVYIMPGNATWMVVELPAGADCERAIEIATKGLVVWNLGDLGDLANKMTRNLRKTHEPIQSVEGA